MGASLSVHSEATKNQSAISGRNYHFELDCHYTKKARPKGLTLQFPSKGLTIQHVHSEAARNQSTVLRKELASSIG